MAGTVVVANTLSAGSPPHGRKSTPPGTGWQAASGTRRVSSGELAVEVGTKVRNSLAGLMGAYCSSARWEEWRVCVRLMWQRESQIRVLLWLEEDPMPGPRARRLQAVQVQMQQLKAKLGWLTKRVFIASQTVGGAPAGLTVTNLPGAGQI